MSRTSGPRYLILLLVLALPILFFTALGQTPRDVAGGKGRLQAGTRPAPGDGTLPLPGEMSTDRTLAQDLALADERVQAHTEGRRAEVFGVQRVVADQFTAASGACATHDCRQVEIYLFEQNAAVVAIVDLQTETVLDVLYQPGVQPGINRRLAQRARQIALDAPQVVSALGFRPQQVDMAPVPGDLVGSSCDGDHLCAAPNFQLGDRILWAVVDLTTEELAGLYWTDMDPDPPGNAAPTVAEGCPAPGSVNRGGWALSYATTASDGLRVYDVTYNGVPVLTSVTHLEWHADYGDSGFRDSTGCGAGGGGFPIPPYGETQVAPLLDDQDQEIGFEVIQDFRLSQWGEYCHYRYEPRLQFYNDGRFRVASGIYGKGCGTGLIYRPIVRIDLSVDGDAGDYLSYWDGYQWATATRELYRLPYEPDSPFASDDGPHQATSEGYAWRVNDAGGAGYFVVADEGQYPQSRDDDPFLYFTRHHENEGDTDMDIIGACCYDDVRQGPHQYVDGESIDGANVVLWYVPQMQTVADEDENDYYCWTVSGEPDPETYPCITGPLFVPSDSAEATQAAFTVEEPLLTHRRATFHNRSSGLPPLSYTWTFGDGSPPSHERNPMHVYTSSGTYTVRLTASSTTGSHTTTAQVEVLPAPDVSWLPLIGKDP